MCGFAGAIIWDETFRVSPTALRRMSAAVAHRGPDGDALRLTREHESITPDEPQVAMAFRRLAILDPDPRSMQPFTDGRRWLVFNGEIYNFRTLRAELSALMPDRPWSTNGDTEVLLAAYACWGEACVEKLNGMFALAVWDDREKILFLARDRMGQKPLYVRTEAGGVFFASELAAVPQSRSPLGNGPWLSTYLRYGASAGPSPWARTVQLAPGHRITVGPKRPGVESCYFDAGDLKGAPVSDETAVRRTSDRVRAAVERQLVSDVPLGVFLSGGVDSSVVAACARRHGPVRTFSMRFDDPRYDESAHARAVATHLKTDHVEFDVKANAAESLPRLAASFGEPFADSSALPTHLLARETRVHVKVALSGDGGDELFGGYARYWAIRLAQRLRPFSALGVLGQRLARGHPKGRFTRAGRFLASLSEDDAGRYDGYLRIFDESTLRLLAPDLQSARPMVRSTYETLYAAHPDPVLAAVACDRRRYLPDDLLTKVDRCSMLHGLEVRSPFMDHELVTFAAGLTTDQLLKGGPKRMLREAFADDLPAWVFTRKKMGFAVPIGDWFRGPLRGMLRDTLFSTHAFGRAHFDMCVVERLVDGHESKRVDHSQRLYALLMLELWWDTVRGSV